MELGCYLRPDPYLSGSAQEGIAIVNGEPSLVDRTITFRQTERSIAAITAYPFNRAQRVEFRAGSQRPRSIKSSIRRPTR